MELVSNEEWEATSVRFEQEAASHGGDLPAISHSPCLSLVPSASSFVKPGWPPKPSISHLSYPPFLFNPAFLFPSLSLSASLLSSIVASSRVDNPLLPPFLPFCSFWSKMFAKTSTVTRHSCPPLNRLIYLSCADTHTLALSLTFS